MNIQDGILTVGHAFHNRKKLRVNELVESLQIVKWGFQLYKMISPTSEDWYCDILWEAHSLDLVDNKHVQAPAPLNLVIIDCWQYKDRCDTLWSQLQYFLGMGITGLWRYDTRIAWRLGETKVT